MACRPTIGITSNNRSWSPSWWCNALGVRLAGGIPIRLYPKRPQWDADVDALIIGGGDDISPELYGAPSQENRHYDAARDQLEIRWIEFALQNNTPLLGICRGAQLINVVLGGTLLPDIRPLRQQTSNRPTLFPLKTVTIQPSSHLATIVPHTTVRVNSLHQQAVATLGRGLIAVAHDQDQFVQGIESSDHQLIGVQWHPEYLFYQSVQRGLYRWLVAQAHHGWL